MMSILPKLPRPVLRIVIGIWRRRWHVVGVAWLTALSGWLATMLIPDSYESRAQVYINTETALDTTISEVGARPNLEKSVSVIRTQLLSRDNLEQVIYETGLDGDISGPVALERKIQSLSDRIKVGSEEARYFVITYADQDPVVAQRVVSSVLDLFVEQNLASSIQDLDRALKSIDREISQRRVDLDEIDAKIAEFRRSNASELAGSGRLTRRIEGKEDELDRIDDQSATVALRRERLVSMLANTPQYAPGSDLDALKLRLASLQSQFNDNYPDIQRLRAQIAELESGSASLPLNPEYEAIQRNLTMAADEISALQARRERVQRDIDQLELDAAQTPEAESELSSMLRERDQIENTYKQLVEQRTEMDLTVNLNEGGAAVDYQRFEAPKVAAEPSWPPRGLLTLAILVISLGVGAAVSFLLSLLDNGYSQAKDLEEAFGLPVLGAISPAPNARTGTGVFADRASLLGVLGALFVCALILFWWQEVRVVDKGAQSVATSKLIEGTIVR